MLSCKSIAHSYAGVQALSGVNLSVGAGEVVGLIGPDGAGKSTMLKIVAGRLKPDKGVVCFDGKEVNALPLWVRVRKGVAYLAEEAPLVHELTVEDNLMVAARSMPNAAETIRTVMEDRSIASLARVKARSLDEGQRRTVELARAVIVPPKLIVMDEPFRGLDRDRIEVVQRTIQEWAAQGIAVLVAERAGGTLLPVCDRAMILESGRVVGEGCAEAMLPNGEV